MYEEHVLQCVAVVLQVCCRCVAVCFSVLQCVAVCCSVLQCVAVCCSALQCVAVCCSVLQCVAYARHKIFYHKPPAPMNHVKYLRDGPAEMPF